MDIIKCETRMYFKILLFVLLIQIISYGCSRQGLPNGRTHSFDKSWEYIEQNINRIKIGDSEEEVSNILGEPDVIYEGRGEKGSTITAGELNERINKKVHSEISSWSYREAGYFASIWIYDINFENHKVVKIESYDF